MLDKLTPVLEAKLKLLEKEDRLREKKTSLFKKMKKSGKRVFKKRGIKRRHNENLYND